MLELESDPLVSYDKEFNEEYFLQAQKYIFRSYQRCLGIDRSCQQFLEELRQKLNLSSEKSAEINKQILECCLYWRQQIEKYVQELLKVIEEERGFTQNAREKMKDCQDILELNNDMCGFAYIDLANKLYEQNQTELAILICNEAINLSNSPVAYETMGYILYSKGQQDAGIKYINEAVRYYSKCKMFEKIEQLKKDLQEMKKANHLIGKVIRWLFEKQN